MSALEWGVDRAHGCALGIGERVGNTSMDHMLLNLYLLGLLDPEDHDLSCLVEYVEKVSAYTGVPIHPVLEGEGPEPIGTRNAAIRYGLGNLVENAIDFAKSSVTVSAAWDDKTLSLTIEDDGPGFAQEILSKIGDPYVSIRGGKSRGKGTAGGLGLGIFIAKTLLERTGGRVQLGNLGPGSRGAMIRVSWPREVFERHQGVDETTD